MARKALLMVFCFVVSVVLTASGSAQPSLKANRMQQPVAVDAFEEIDGFIGKRLRANVENYLKPFDIERHVRAVERRDQRSWSWVVGEQPGKWLESIALNAAWMGDEQLRRKAETMMARIIQSQEPSGYVGVTDPAIRTPEKPLRGMDAYELYFMMHGLLTAAEEWNNEQALQAARRLGDYFESTIGPGKAEFWPSDLRYPENRERFVGGQSDIAGHGVHYSWEGTLLIDPMLRLYELTGDDKYLNWSKWVIANIDRWSGWDSFSKLDKVAEGKMEINEVQPYVHSHTFQMNFLGFLRMYQLTGDESYLRKVHGVWDDVARRQMYITGGVSVGEHYAAGFIRPITGHVVETCATMSWMQLTQYLLELTGNPRYADAIERLMLNHVFAAQTIDGDNVRYHTPPNGTKNDYFHGPNCCTGSGHRIISMLPLFFYATDQEGPIVNQYVPSSAVIELEGGRGAIKVVQQTSYPETETIRLHLTPSRSIEQMKVRLRIPAWTSNPTLVAPEGMTVRYRWVDQENRPRTSTTRPQNVASYAEISGRWQGDVTQTIVMTLPMETRWIKRENHVGDRIVRLRGGQDEQVREAVEEPYAPYALLRGPIVYVYDTVWQKENDPLPPDMLGFDPDNPAPVRKAHTPDRAMGPGLLTRLNTPDGEKAEVLMLPFTNIGRWYRDEAEKNRVRNSNAYPYAVWLKDVNSEDFQKAVALSEQLRNAIDYIIIGNVQSEQDHEVDGGSTGMFNGRTYRHAPGGGSISWTLRVDTQAPSKLVVTYWGDEPDPRTFDILINGRKIATQRLYRDGYNGFIEREYDIPFDLIEGKTTQFGQKVDSVRVEFKSQESTIGGIFGLRTERKVGRNSEQTILKTARHTFNYCYPNALVLMRDTHIIPNSADGKSYAVGTPFCEGAVIARRIVGRKNVVQ